MGATDHACSVTVLQFKDPDGAGRSSADVRPMDEFRGSLKGIKHFRTAVAPETIQANAQLLHASNNEVGWRAAGHIILGGGLKVSWVALQEPSGALVALIFSAHPSAAHGDKFFGLALPERVVRHV